MDCPTCGIIMQERTGKFGAFYFCPAQHKCGQKTITKTPKVEGVRVRGATNQTRHPTSAALERMHHTVCVGESWPEDTYHRDVHVLFTPEDLQRELSYLGMFL